MPAAQLTPPSADTLSLPDNSPPSMESSIRTYSSIDWDSSISIRHGLMKFDAGRSLLRVRWMASQIIGGG